MTILSDEDIDLYRENYKVKYLAHFIYLHQAKITHEKKEEIKYLKWTLKQLINYCLLKYLELPVRRFALKRFAEDEEHFASFYFYLN